MGDFILGCDLGRVRDFTAIAIIERLSQPEDAPLLHLRHLERVPKGTRYPAVVELVGRRKQALFDGGGEPVLVVDHTGVGVAVVDLFEDAGLEPIAITITGGDVVSQEGTHVRVPKRELVTSTHVAMDTGRLKFAATLPDLPTLEQELANFNYKISDTGHDSYGAWREGKHDDLVLAVALAVWYAEQQVSPANLINSGAFLPTVLGAQRQKRHRDDIDSFWNWHSMGRRK